MVSFMGDSVAQNVELPHENTVKKMEELNQGQGNLGYAITPKK